MHKKIKYHTFIGKKFGKWKILNYEGFVKSSIPKYKWQGVHLFKCMCKCGKIRIVPLNNLTSGNSKGCQSCAVKKHGLTGTYLYSVWLRIMYNNKHKNVKVCKRWFDIKKFVYDVNKILGPKPSNKVKFVMKDNNKGFFKWNVEWSIHYKKFAKV